MKEQEGEREERRQEEERKAAASVGKLKSFINCVCFERGSSSTECSGS